VNVLLTVDESTYAGGTMGADHPIAWYHAYGGGRSFYTGLGHTEATYADPLFLTHLLGGIEYAAAGPAVRSGTIVTPAVPGAASFAPASAIASNAAPAGVSVFRAPASGDLLGRWIADPFDPLLDSRESAPDTRG
jgi:hypothetical protein